VLSGVFQGVLGVVKVTSESSCCQFLDLALCGQKMDKRCSSTVDSGVI